MASAGAAAHANEPTKHSIKENFPISFDSLLLKAHQIINLLSSNDSFLRTFSNG